MADYRNEIASKIQDAYKNKQPLYITAGGTKQFYGREICQDIQAKPLSVAHHTGIIEYEPSELYISAKSGTPLADIEQTIANENQILPCEPPQFGAAATLGGTIACGIAGPRRVTAGNVRDCMLGTEILNGKGEHLRFGGRVMKNVAGYDISRLMCGALGTLGVILSVTLRLLPKPELEQTIVFALDSNAAIAKMNQWANTPMPVSASFYDGNNLYIRLSGSSSAIQACKKDLGGDPINSNDTFWNSVKEQTHHFFSSAEPLWRISVPPSTEPLNLSGSHVIEWNGALRWYRSSEDESVLRAEVERVGGHANLFKGSDSDKVFHPLSKTSMRLHKNIKQTLDPAGILNPGKMFAEL